MLGGVYRGVRQAAILGVVSSTGYLPQMAMMNEADVLLMCTCGVSTCSCVLLMCTPANIAA